jgi:predicted amidohydrolase
MNVVGLQFDIAWEDKAANFATVKRLLMAAKPARESLVVLPEMFPSGFSLDAAKVADSYGGETEQFLGATAREFGIYIVAGVAMRGPNGSCRNKAVVFSPKGDLIAYYAKMHPFSPANEATAYIAGDKPASFRWGEITVSPFICYDVRFPEIFRAAAAAWRPELFVVIANFPDKRINHWMRLLQARAIENQAYVIGVNRVGTDPQLSYNGHSIIIDPQGDIIVDAGEKESIIQAELDFANLRKYRDGLKFLDDIRGVARFGV